METSKKMKNEHEMSKVQNIIWGMMKDLKKYLDENNIPYEKIDISEKENEEALVRIGGKRQVPFIIDTDKNIEMYESNDILEYLKTL